MPGKIIEDIISQGRSSRRGFWHGNPHPETALIYGKALGLKADSPGFDVDLACALGSDMIWINGEYGFYKDPRGRPMWDCHGGRERRSLSEPGVFAECEDVKEVEAFDWPNPDYMDFTGLAEHIDYAREKGLAVIGGMWMPFFHVAADFFGMDNYFIKMYTHPEVVEAVTNKILDFYREANRRCLALVGDKLVAGFFGNDFGSQRDLLISPDAFDRFVLPGVRRLADTIQKAGLPVFTHSCGAVSRIIPKLIDCGITGLHPLQANAAGMSAEELAPRFRKDLIFIGGVDTQDLLPFRSAREVSDRVGKLQDLFGERYVVSPSHEAILPNVPLENVQAVVERVKGKS